MFDQADGCIVGAILIIVLVTLMTGWLELAWAAALLTFVGMFRSWPE